MDPYLLQRLCYGWDNEAWSANPEFLQACVRHFGEGRGDVLECGSGLSTVLLGVLAEDSGRRLWALEHSGFWAARVRSCLDRYGIRTVSLCVSDLRTYAGFDWYDPPLSDMPNTFGLVVCDGPPGETPGGRYGLLPVMRMRLKHGCVILLDDVERPEERAIVQRWAREAGAEYAIEGAVRPYAVMRLHL